MTTGSYFLFVGLAALLRGLISLTKLVLFVLPFDLITWVTGAYIAGRFIIPLFVATIAYAILPWRRSDFNRLESYLSLAILLRIATGTKGTVDLSYLQKRLREVGVEPDECAG